MGTGVAYRIPQRPGEQTLFARFWIYARRLREQPRNSRNRRRPGRRFDHQPWTLRSCRRPDGVSGDAKESHAQGSAPLYRRRGRFLSSIQPQRGRRFHRVRHAVRSPQVARAERRARTVGGADRHRRSRFHHRRRAAYEFRTRLTEHLGQLRHSRRPRLRRERLSRSPFHRGGTRRATRARSALA